MQNAELRCSVNCIYHLPAGQSGGLMETWIMTHRSISLRNQQESRIIYKLCVCTEGQPLKGSLRVETKILYRF